MKQLSGNDRPDSLDRTWNFFVAALATFPPPRVGGFDTVVAHFLKDRAPPAKRDALHAALYAAVYGGERRSPLPTDAIPKLVAAAFGGPISARYLDHDLIKSGAAKVPPPPPPSPY